MKCFCCGRELKTEKSKKRGMGDLCFKRAGKREIKKQPDLFSNINMKNRINIYTCAKGHQTITKDLNEGTTPFMVICQHPSDCMEMAKSCMYMCDQTLQHTHEWYMPVTLHKLEPDLRAHVLKGGLLLKKRGEVTRWMHQIKQAERIRLAFIEKRNKK